MKEYWVLMVNGDPQGITFNEDDAREWERGGPGRTIKKVGELH